MRRAWRRPDIYMTAVIASRFPTSEPPGGDHNHQDDEQQPETDLNDTHRNPERAPDVANVTGLIPAHCDHFNTEPIGPECLYGPVFTTNLDVETRDLQLAQFEGGHGELQRRVQPTLARSRGERRRIQDLHGRQADRVRPLQRRPCRMRDPNLHRHPVAHSQERGVDRGHQPALRCCGRGNANPCRDPQGDPR